MTVFLPLIWEILLRRNIVHVNKQTKRERRHGMVKVTNRPSDNLKDKPFRLNKYKYQLEILGISES